MKQLLCGLLLTIFLSACATRSPAPTVSAAVPAASVPAAGQAGIITASARVVPAKVSQMAFLITANVTAVDVKEGDPVQAGQTLMRLDTPDLQLAVTAAEAAVRSAQSTLDRLNYPYTKLYRGGQVVYVKEDFERRQEAQAQLAAQQAALASARAALAQATLSAPYAGTVVTLNVVPGQLVQAGQNVAVIGDLEHLQIETIDLSERVIAGVKVGQPASVHIQALDQDLQGKVTAIAPISTKYNSDWVYKVTIQLDTQPQGLTWGMSADVSIHTQ
jgi:RND family efflux transporter MFP subunit